MVFTPLHGCGGFCAGEVLEAQGFRPIPVPEQATPDGQFPNVTEDPEPGVARVHGPRRAAWRTSTHADLVISTDPDADRIGALASTRRRRQGRLPLHHGQRDRGPADALQAEPAGPERVAAGFADRHHHRGDYGANHPHRPASSGRRWSTICLSGSSITPMCSPSLKRPGSMATSAARRLTSSSPPRRATASWPRRRSATRTPACAALLLAEAALWQKRHGQTLLDYLDDLNRQFGYFRNELLNIVMTGLEGKMNMARMLDALRKSPPKEIGGLPVVAFEDLQDEAGRLGPFKGETDKAARNFLIFRLASSDGLAAKVCLRPSGTEPKAKAYIEVSCEPRPATMADVDWVALCGRVDTLAQELARDFHARALTTVDLAGSRPAIDRCRFRSWKEVQSERHHLPPTFEIAPSSLSGNSTSCSSRSSGLRPNFASAGAEQAISGRAGFLRHLLLRRFVLRWFFRLRFG